MGKLAAAGLAAAIIVSVSGMSGATTAARAVGLCSCCAQAPTDDCRSACTAITPEPGQCPAVVIYEGTGQEGEGGNPLNGMSLKDLSLGEPSAPQLESLRRFLEKYRRAAVRAYRTADRRHRRGGIDKAAMDAAQSALDEALVNYQHGIRAYLNKIGRKSD